MTADPARLRALHVEVRGDSMEPDPAKPGYMRPTVFCRWCADHRPDEDMRWPCETVALLDRLERAEAALLDIERMTKPMDYADGQRARGTIGSIYQTARAALERGSE